MTRNQYTLINDDKWVQLGGEGVWHIAIQPREFFTACMASIPVESGDSVHDPRGERCQECLDEQV